jgi:predicted transposase YdaD
VPLPFAALVHAAKGNPVIAALVDRARADGRAEGKREGKREGTREGKREGLVNAVLAVLALRDLRPLPHERVRIFAETDGGRLERWHALALTCARVDELFDLE